MMPAAGAGHRADHMATLRRLAHELLIAGETGRLLDDFEPETTTAEVSELFDELKPEVVPLIAALRDEEADDSFLTGAFPVERQEAIANEVVGLFGMRPESWRLDPTEHPFASGAG